MAVDFWIAALLPLSTALAMAPFSSARARKEDVQNIAAAERTRGARDMVCSHLSRPARESHSLTTVAVAESSRCPAASRLETASSLIRLIDFSRIGRHC